MSWQKKEHHQTSNTYVSWNKVAVYLLAALSDVHVPNVSYHTIQVLLSVHSSEMIVAESLKLEAMKRIIGMLARGRDVGDLFPAVVKNVVSKNIEIKKLVYVYLTRSDH